MIRVAFTPHSTARFRTFSSLFRLFEAPVFFHRPANTIFSRPNSRMQQALQSMMTKQDALNTSITPPRDPCTLSNYTNFKTAHTVLDFNVDFDKQILNGKVTLHLKSVSNAGTKEIVLDSSFVEVSSVKVNGEPSKYEFISNVEHFGTPLKIELDRAIPENDIAKVEMDVSTTDKCTALQWFEPSLTSTGKFPYMFSQCQAIHARSIFPCQDTPDVKSTFDYRLRSKLPVLASGLLKGVEDVPSSDEKIYLFEQGVPIPSYLCAIASGDIKGADIGPRSTVWTSPDRLDACQWEFEKDMEFFLETAESIITPYVWGTYNILVLPPSFPYGGMENPVYTFATPTVITGDRNSIDLVAHELCHSWSGNLVSAASWEHFWLNEGWTTYLERRLMRKLLGEPRRAFSSAIGWTGLQEAINNFGHDHEFTKLIPDLRGKDPDDAFSKVPYEKGFAFLYYLERLIGMEKWDKFIPHYFTQFKGKSIDSYDFKSCLLDFYANDSDTSKLLQSSVDWDKWFYGAGLPMKPEFDDTSLVDMCGALAEKWRTLADNPTSSTFAPSAADVDGWSSGQSQLFLKYVDQFPKPLTPQLVRMMDQTYGYGKTQNVMILTPFYVIGLKARDETFYKPASELLGTVGRMLFVRPLFKAMRDIDRKMALEVYEKNKHFYHPICRSRVERILSNKTDE